MNLFAGRLLSHYLSVSLPEFAYFDDGTVTDFRLTQHLQD